MKRALSLHGLSWFLVKFTPKSLSNFSRCAIQREKHGLNVVQSNGDSKSGPRTDALLGEKSDERRGSHQDLPKMANDLFIKDKRGESVLMLLRRQ